MGVEFSSKVCQFYRQYRLQKLGDGNAKTCYAKFVIVDDFVKVEGATFLENIREEGIKEIIREVAQLADEWELKLTGLDVN